MELKEYILEDSKGVKITGKLVKWLNEDYTLSDSPAIWKACVVDPQLGKPRAFISEPIESFLEKSEVALKFITHSNLYTLREYTHTLSL